MTMVGLMQKTMYEKVGEYRIARENKMFHNHKGVFQFSKNTVSFR